MTVPRLVGADRARQHIKWLRSSGVGLPQIHRLTGCAYTHLRKIHDGQLRRVRRTTEQAILAVLPLHAADGARPYTDRYRQMLDEMYDAGATKRHVAKAIGYSSVDQLAHRTSFTVGTGKAITAAYDAWRNGDLELTDPDGETIEPPPRPQPDISKLLDELATSVQHKEAEWRQRAACRDHPTWMFFPSRGDTATTAKAKAICARCPVSTECAASFSGERFGVFAGLSAGERRRARDNQQEVAV